jgi:hypothetical protein
MYYAQITFFGPERGGRHVPPLSGYHPQIQLGAIMTSCVIESLAGVTVFPFDQPCEVVIRLLFPQEYDHLLQTGMHVRFFEGTKYIGAGYIRDKV